MEQDLIERARGGDDGAFADWVRLHQDAAFRLAYLMLGDTSAAHDVTQTAFIRLYDALNTLDTSRPLRPYLLRTVTNLARNRRRSVGRYWAALARYARSIAERQSVPSIEALVSERVQAQQLWQAVERLRPHEQEVIYMRFFLDLSVNETAEALDIAVGTVKSRTSRALDALKGVIQREFPDLVPTVHRMNSSG